MSATLTQSITALQSCQKHELVQASLIEAQASQSVFTRLYPERALAAANYPDAHPKGGLSGLPVSIKDLLDVAGETTMAGSVVLSEQEAAAQDAPVVARLRQAGAAIVGKTNMTEFAFSGVGLNPHYGTPVNPVDKLVARIPGGSSSGAAVSVAAGMCVAAIGSDTGGSIRIPAALCGLVGFKSTMRRVPVTGTVPLSTSLDTICAMTRSVQDCLLVDAAIANAPLTLPGLSLAGLRLALPQTIVLDELDNHVAASFEKALSKLSTAGAQIIEIPMHLLIEARQINFFSPIEAFAWHRDLLAQSPDAYDQRVAARIRLGANYADADYLRAQTARAEWIKRVSAELEGFDALLMPTVPMVAPPIADLEASDDTYFEINRLMLRNPSLINLMDGCAITLPCHEHGTLPVGLSVAGGAMTDAHIIATAQLIETALSQEK